MRPGNKVSLLLRNSGTSVPAYDSLIRLLAALSQRCGCSNAQGQRRGFGQRCQPLPRCSRWCWKSERQQFAYGINESCASPGSSEKVAKMQRIIRGERSAAVAPEQRTLGRFLQLT
jgi:hypothetical protein